MRRLVVLAVAVALLAAACGDDDDGTDGAAKVAQEFGVTLDAKTDAFNGEFAAFFPDALTVRAGDTVKFSLPRFSGVPHTVTLGTLVDKAVAKLDQLGPTASIAAQENAAEVLNLPDVFPHKNPPQGPPDANQSAAQACFLDSGVPPLSLTGSAPACPKRVQPELNGTQSFYNSGVLDKDGAAFSVKVASSIRPGTYGMICLIHRGAMTAKLTVVGEGAVPGPAEVSAKGRQQLDEIVKGLTPVAAGLQKSPADKAAIGGGDPRFFNTIIAEFGPKSVSIPVGGSVTWTAFGFHTLSLGAADSDVGVTTTEPNGTVHLAAKSGAPVGFALPPVLFEFPPEDSAKPVALDLGRYDGSGFRNTGIFGSLPPQIVSLKLTFTRAGTYPIRCLVHPDMKGDVKVG